MHFSLPRALVLGVTAIAASGYAFPQTQRDVGKREYDFNCAGCHGPKGEGNGPYTRYLNVKVPNLATLARRNNGVFPDSRLYSIIDGRTEVKGHGPRNMPVWGADYLVQAHAAAPEDSQTGVSDPEAYVRKRILALVDYISRLQIK